METPAKRLRIDIALHRPMATEKEARRPEDLAVNTVVNHPALIFNNYPTVIRVSIKGPVTLMTQNTGTTRFYL